MCCKVGIGKYRVISSRILLGMSYVLGWVGVSHRIILFLTCLVAKGSCKVLGLMLVKRESTLLPFFFQLKFEW